MKLFAQRALIALAAASMTLAACSNMRNNPSSYQSVSINGRPFGGTPAVDIPPSAYAMGAYLKAQMATEDGDRAKALQEYEQAVHYDPHNSTLHLQLADLYVGDGRLRDALEQAQEAIDLDPDYVHARLLTAGINSALGDNAAAQEQYEKVVQLDPKGQEAYLFLGTLYAQEGDYNNA
jgi:tetratricopeptide (TPR) repeat protein